MILLTLTNSLFLKKYNEYTVTSQLILHNNDDDNHI